MDIESEMGVQDHTKVFYSRRRENGRVTNNEWNR